jgi:hypothetical protein
LNWSVGTFTPASGVRAVVDELEPRGVDRDQRPLEDDVGLTGERVAGDDDGLTVRLAEDPHAGTGRRRLRAAGDARPLCGALERLGRRVADAAVDDLLAVELAQQDEVVAGVRALELDREPASSSFASSVARSAGWWVVDDVIRSLSFLASDLV